MKIFCIGFNKTGTTSLSKLFSDAEFSIAPQRIFIKYIKAYMDNEYDKIIEVVKNKYDTYDFFPNIPFSFPNFYLSLYKNFPTAKYILSVRNSSKEWYESAIRYSVTFKKTMKSSNSAMNMETYRNIWMQFITTHYNEEQLIQSYEKHNAEVREFFKDKDNFIEINLSNSEDFNKLEKFLNIKFKSDTFPHLNRTK